MADRIKAMMGQLHAALFMAFPFVAEGEWYKQQTESLSDIFAELMVDNDPHVARKAIAETITSWTDYHKKELDKWNTLRNLLNL